MDALAFSIITPDTFITGVFCAQILDFLKRSLESTRLDPHLFSTLRAGFPKGAVRFSLLRLHM